MDHSIQPAGLFSDEFHSTNQLFKKCLEMKLPWCTNEKYFGEKLDRGKALRGYHGPRMQNAIEGTGWFVKSVTVPSAPPTAGRLI